MYLVDGGGQSVLIDNEALFRNRRGEVWNPHGSFTMHFRILPVLPVPSGFKSRPGNYTKSLSSGLQGCKICRYPGSGSQRCRTTVRRLDRSESRGIGEQTPSRARLMCQHSARVRRVSPTPKSSIASKGKVGSGAPSWKRRMIPANRSTYFFFSRAGARVTTSFIYDGPLDPGCILTWTGFWCCCGLTIATRGPSFSGLQARPQQARAVSPT